MNIDKTNNIAYVEGKAYHLVPIEDEKLFICEIDGKKYYLGPEAKKEMNWYHAKAWAKDVGGILMTREVAIIVLKNDELRKHFRVDDVYWLDEECSSSYAWYQNFFSGGQSSIGKTSAFYVRAVYVE